MKHFCAFHLKTRIVFKHSKLFSLITWQKFKRYTVPVNSISKFNIIVSLYTKYILTKNKSPLLSTVPLLNRQSIRDIQSSCEKFTNRVVHRTPLRMKWQFHEDVDSACGINRDCQVMDCLPTGNHCDVFSLYDNHLLTGNFIYSLAL